MLDFDLAQMYGTETAQLKRTIRRNKKRFDGEDFMFEVTRDELSKCQIGTLNKGRGSNIKYLPFAFTELGVAILSSVLNSETAIEINKGIMRAFVAIRQLITNPPSCRNEELQQEMKKLRNYMEEIRHPHTTRTHQSDTGRIAGTSKIVRQTAPPYRFYPPGRRLIESLIPSEYSEKL